MQPRPQKRRRKAQISRWQFPAYEGPWADSIMSQRDFDTEERTAPRKHRSWLSPRQSERLSHERRPIIDLMIELDGSMGEGGGQILRTSLALSLITQKSFRLFNVRAGRQKPGLQPQHLASVRAAATIGQANVRGDAVGSREIAFERSEEHTS